MKHLELTKKALEKQCNAWANNIKEVYQPDLTKLNKKSPTSKQSESGGMNRS